MKPKNISLITIASLSLAIPIALAQRPNNPPTNQPMQNRGMTSRLFHSGFPFLWQA